VRRLANTRLWRYLYAVLLGLVIVAPIVVLIVTGSVGAFAVIYAAEAVIGLVAHQVARRLGLPAWAPDEAYITRLRRWRRARQL
jgi:hypothetical protein